MIDKLINWLNDLLNRLKEFVGDVNSTNWVIFTGTGAGMLTAVVVLACLAFEVQLQLEALIAWLAFCSSWIGFGVRQFRHKRETFNDPTRSERGKPANGAAQPVEDV